MLGSYKKNPPQVGGFFVFAKVNGIGFGH